MTDQPPARHVLEHADQNVAAPQLDAAQRAVVDHPGGPLLVLAGPGTGKTTTLVEAIVDRVERRGADPSSVLALTFSRKAAEQLRDRVTARLGRTTSAAIGTTFHSFAYGLVRRFSPPDLYAAPLRLLSAPEQDVVLRELLNDSPEAVVWPEELQRAQDTRGFAHEVQAVLARAREKGYDGLALRRLGAEHGREELVAAGLFLEHYLTVLDQQSATDYSDLVRRAVIEAEVHREELRGQLRHVFVDEYQDTDPAQVGLLRALAGGGRDLTVVGDPHQSIYAFRGAEVRGILEFPRAFPRTDGSDADVVALRTTRRFGPRLLTATQRVASRLALPAALPAGARAAFLEPLADPPAAVGPGRVEVTTYETERAEAEHLADLLRRAHLEDGVPWDDMAVLVRSGRASIPGLRRALVAAGVPVEVAGDELPLVRDPAARPLLDGLRAVVHLDNDDPDDVDHLDPGRAEALLTGPLGGLDAADVRLLGRALRVRDKAVAETESRPARTSRELMRDAVCRVGSLDGIQGRAAARALELQRLLHATRARLLEGATAEELLWMLWAGTGWQRRLRAAIDAGGAAARRGHRDLDALVALFDAAARAEEQRDHAGVRNFLATLVAQQIPADTLAERAVRGSSVRLMTAHRSKGLEWSLVVVAHVQAEGWPDLRRRTTLLRADRIASDGLVEPAGPRELLLDERRLFYVACTRARRRLVVSAVASPEDDGEQPSRFLGELGVTVEHVAGRPSRPLSLAGLVAELRRTVTDPDTDEPLRNAAARRLARLAAETVRDRQVAPAADPATWWGTRGRSHAALPLRDPETPVPVSATMLEQMGICPARWFWRDEAGGVERAHQEANVGSLVHALAERVISDGLTSGPDDVEELMVHVGAVWDRLHFRTPWSKAREEGRVRKALARFLQWHHAGGREVLATEVRFRTAVELTDGERVELHGYADRVELDSDGRVVVVDLKTSRRAPSRTSVLTNPQLALYQLAVDHGALDAELGTRVAELGGEVPLRSGGGELVQLGALEDGPAVVQPQPEMDDTGAEREALRTSLAGAASQLREERFPAVPGNHCRDCSFVPICPARSAGSVLDR